MVYGSGEFYGGRVPLWAISCKATSQTKVGDFYGGRVLVLLQEKKKKIMPM